MLAIERRELITKLLQDKKSVIVNELSRLYGVTEETIRRDLDSLERAGVAKKTYGGAVLNDTAKSDLPYADRKKTNVDKKMIVAEIVAALIEDNSFVMLDSSTTAAYVVKRLKSKKNITIISNSLEIIMEASEHADWRVMCTGGVLKPGHLSFVGNRAEEALRSLHADIAIVSCKGISLDGGFTDTNDNDIYIKREMLRGARRRIVAADSSKFGRTSFINAFGFEDIDILATDEAPGDEWTDLFEKSGIEVRLPDMEHKPGVRDAKQEQSGNGG